jgi:hypothetical protein
MHFDSRPSISVRDMHNHLLRSAPTGHVPLERTLAAARVRSSPAHLHPFTEPARPELAIVAPGYWLPTTVRGIDTDA